MNIKFLLPLIFLCLIISCGKKGDPVYKESKQNLQFNEAIIKNI